MNQAAYGSHGPDETYIEFTRLLDSLVLSELPDAVDRLSSLRAPYADNVFCAFAEKNLAADVRDQYLSTRPSLGATKCWAGTNEFEQKRSREAFMRDEFPKILAAARDIRLPMDVAIVSRFYLGNYDFGSKSFPLNIPGLDSYTINRTGLPVGYRRFGGAQQQLLLDVPDLSVPKGWEISESAAQKLLEGPFSGTRQGTAVLVLELTQLAHDDRNSGYLARIVGQAKRLELYPGNRPIQGKPVRVYDAPQLIGQAQVRAASQAEMEASAAGRRQAEANAQ